MNLWRQNNHHHIRELSNPRKTHPKKPHPVISSVPPATSPTTTSFIPTSDVWHLVRGFTCTHFHHYIFYLFGPWRESQICKHDCTRRCPLVWRVVSGDRQMWYVSSFNRQAGPNVPNFSFFHVIVKGFMDGKTPSTMCAHVNVPEGWIPKRPRFNGVVRRLPRSPRWYGITCSHEASCVLCLVACSWYDMWRGEMGKIGRMYKTNLVLAVGGCLG